MLLLQVVAEDFLTGRAGVMVMAEAIYACGATMGDGQGDGRCDACGDAACGDRRYVMIGAAAGRARRASERSARGTGTRRGASHGGVGVGGILRAFCVFFSLFFTTHTHVSRRKRATTEVIPVNLYRRSNTRRHTHATTTHTLRHTNEER